MVFAKGQRRGFSLIEMIAAAVLLSGGVVAICAVSTQSIRAIRANRKYELAWEILDRQLTLIDYMGIDEFIELGETQGQFGTEAASGPVYYWQVQITEGQADNLYRVDMTVSWGTENHSNSVSAATVFNGTGTVMLLSAGGE